MKSFLKIEQTAADFARKVKRLSQPVWKVLTTSPDEAVAPASCLCAEIGKGYLDVLYANRQLSKYSIRSRKIYRFAENALPTPDETAASIALAFKDFDIKKTDVVLVIPKSWVILKPASLPAAASENLRDVVSYELDRFTPFTADESFYDFVIDKRTDQNINILIAAAKASSVNPYIASLLERDIAVGKITFDVSGSATLCRFTDRQELFDFFEVDTNGIQFGSVRRGLLVHASSTDFRSDNETMRAEMAEAFLVEQKGISDGINGNVQLIAYFTNEVSGLREVLRSRGKIYKILDGVDNKISGFSYRDGMSISLAGSALEQLWPRAESFNLISKGFRPSVKRPFLVTWLLLAILIICLGIYLFVPIQTEQERLAEIDRQINIRKDEVKNVEKLRNDLETISKQMALVDDFKHGKPANIDLLKEMTLAIPKNSWLTRMRVAGTQVNIEGYAPSATPLIQVLEGSKYFNKVEFASPTFRDVRLNMDRFQIKMEIRERKPEAVSENK